MADLFKKEILLKKAFFLSEVGKVPETDSTVVAQDALKGMVVGLFFSAAWCPPCQSFVPKLVHFYQELQKKKRPFQIVFISIDNDEPSMKDYFLHYHGDWLCLPFGHSLKPKLMQQYDVDCIPRLIIIGEDGTVVSTTGRKSVEECKGNKMALFKQWYNVVNKEKPTEVAATVEVQESSTSLSPVAKDGLQGEPLDLGAAGQDPFSKATCTKTSEM